MGCKPSKQASVKTAAVAQQPPLGPPTKIMDASEHAQHLVYLVKKTLETQVLGLEYLGHPFPQLQATHMITQQVLAPKLKGTVYYIKVHTAHDQWPYVFCKIYDPPLVTDVSPVTLQAFKKMTDDYQLVVF